MHQWLGYYTKVRPNRASKNYEYKVDMVGNTVYHVRFGPVQMQNLIVPEMRYLELQQKLVASTPPNYATILNSH